MYVEQNVQLIFKLRRKWRIKLHRKWRSYWNSNNF